MAVPVTSIDVEVGATTGNFQVEAFASDGTDLGPDTDSPTESIADTALATLNDQGAGKFSVTGIASGSTSCAATDAKGRNVSVPVNVTMAVASIGIVAVP